MVKAPKVPKVGETYLIEEEVRGESEVVELEILAVTEREGEIYISLLAKMNKSGDKSKIVPKVFTLRDFNSIQKVNKNYMDKVKDYFQKKEELKQFRKSMRFGVKSDTKLARLFGLKDIIVFAEES